MSAKKTMKYLGNLLPVLLLTAYWPTIKACKKNEDRVLCNKLGLIPGENCPGVESWTCLAGMKRCACVSGTFLNAQGHCVSKEECGPAPTRRPVTSTVPPKPPKPPMIIDKSSVAKYAVNLLGSSEDLLLVFVSPTLVELSRTRCTRSKFVGNSSSGYERTVEYFAVTQQSEDAQSWIKQQRIVNISVTNGSDGRMEIEVRANFDEKGSDEPEGVYEVLYATSSTLILGEHAETGVARCSDWAYVQHA
uniref:Putative group vii salivary lipocalin n=1 Tax=Amblyomma tuberculatum TaxID=48802 RepID=A0A6M2E8E8_9ACAR